MAHFAEIDQDGYVVRVLVVANEDITGSDGKESEALGRAFLRKLLGGGQWVQCSYNNNFRGCYPGPGYRYDRQADRFEMPPDLG